LKLKNLYRIPLCFTAFLFITGCGSDYETEIIGEWKDKGNNVIEFSAEGVVKGLAKNVNREKVEGTYKVNNDSLYIDFLVAPDPRNIMGTLEFKIQKLNRDSLILYTSIGNLNYGRVIK
jgi:hypothetical protein